MNKNLEMGPGVGERFEKRDLERTKSSKIGTWNVSDPPVTLSKRWPPRNFLYHQLWLIGIAAFITALNYSKEN